MKDVREVKKEIESIVETVLEAEKNNKEELETRTRIVEAIKKEVTKLKEAGEIDDFVCGWELYEHYFLWGWQFRYDVHFTRDDEISHVEVNGAKYRLPAHCVN